MPARQAEILQKQVRPFLSVFECCFGLGRISKLDFKTLYMCTHVCLYICLFTVVFIYLFSVVDICDGVLDFAWDRITISVVDICDRVLDFAWHKMNHSHCYVATGSLLCFII